MTLPAPVAFVWETGASLTVFVWETGASRGAFVWETGASSGASGRETGAQAMRRTIPGCSRVEAVMRLRRCSSAIETPVRSAMIHQPSFGRTV